MGIILTTLTFQGCKDEGRSMSDLWYLSNFIPCASITCLCKSNLEIFFKRGKICQLLIFVSPYNSRLHHSSAQSSPEAPHFTRNTSQRPYSGQQWPWFGSPTRASSSGVVSLSPPATQSCLSEEHMACSFTPSGPLLHGVVYVRASLAFLFNVAAYHHWHSLVPLLLPSCPVALTTMGHGSCFTYVLIVCLPLLDFISSVRIEIFVWFLLCQFIAPTIVPVW